MIFFQVVPVPRQLVSEVPPPLMQVLPPPPPPPNPVAPPLYDSYVPIVQLPGPPPDMIHPGQTMIPVIGPLQPGPGPMGSVLSPPIQLHYSHSQIIPAEQVIYLGVNGRV